MVRRGRRSRARYWAPTSRPTWPWSRSIPARRLGSSPSLSAIRPRSPWARRSWPSATRWVSTSRCPQAWCRPHTASCSPRTAPRSAAASRPTPPSTPATPAVSHRRPGAGHRHQRAGRLAVRRQRGHRVRGADRHGRPGHGADQVRHAAAAGPDRGPLRRRVDDQPVLRPAGLTPEAKDGGADRRRCRKNGRPRLGSCSRVAGLVSSPVSLASAFHRPSPQGYARMWVCTGRTCSARRLRDRPGHAGGRSTPRRAGVVE
jgi:hypothetical protein